VDQVDSSTAAAIDFCSLSSTLVIKRTSQMIRYALQSERLGPLPLVNHFIQRMGLEDALDRYLPTDPRCIPTDEARFGRMNRPRPCWAPTGVRPKVACQLVREFIYLIWGLRCQEQKRSHKHLFLALFVAPIRTSAEIILLFGPCGAHPSVPTRGFSGPSRAGAVKDGRCSSGSARTTFLGHSLTGPSKTASLVASGDDLKH
jgi:hypothetical protein